MNKISWAGRDKDRFFGPFTISSDASYPQWGAVVTSADDEDRPANARIHLHKLTVLFPLPDWLIKPHRERVEFRHISDADRERRLPALRQEAPAPLCSRIRVPLQQSFIQRD